MGRIINVARWQNKVRAMFGIDGENPIPTLDELLPVAIVEGDRIEREAAGTVVEFMGDSQDIAAGGAGNVGQVVLLNPSNSGVIIALEGWDAWGTAAVFVDVSGITETTTLASYTRLGPGFQFGNPRDGRFFGQGAAAQLWFRNNAAFGPGSYRYRVNAKRHHDARGLFVMPPGRGYVFADATANEVFRAAFFWRETPLEQGAFS